MKLVYNLCALKGVMPKTTH